MLGYWIEPGSNDCQPSPDEPCEEPSGALSPPKCPGLSSMLLVLPELLERLVPVDGDEDEFALRGTFIASPLEDDEVSWLLL